MTMKKMMKRMTKRMMMMKKMSVRRCDQLVFPDFDCVGLPTPRYPSPYSLAKRSFSVFLARIRCRKLAGVIGGSTRSPIDLPQSSCPTQPCDSARARPPRTCLWERCLLRRLLDLSRAVRASCTRGTPRSGQRGETSGALSSRAPRHRIALKVSASSLLQLKPFFSSSLQS